MPGKKTCFVVMGFGKKTDFQTGRTLDLDKAYHNMIKPAVEECGLECVRADEIRHSGVIDVPMYRQLLQADLVIADLSTSNANAMYELGVRHALRPYTTIVVAESQLKYPFDVNHTTVRKYVHLGEGIDFDEVMRFRGELKQSIQALIDKQEKDSPVYTFLPDLDPPTRAAIKASAAAATFTVPASEQALSEKLAAAEAAMKNDDFAGARKILAEVRAMKPADAPQTANDDFVVQRLAFAVYKSKQPTAPEALKEAESMLRSLKPESTHDTETLGLWGAVQKRLFDETKDPARLDLAITAYERGFILRRDYYNGINLAFLLHTRSCLPGAVPEEAVADFVQANRIRKAVTAICERIVEGRDPTNGAFVNRETSDQEVRYWLRATLAEAFLGMGDEAQSAQWLVQAKAQGPDPWMIRSTEEQLAKVKALLERSPLRFLGKAG